MLFSLQAKNYNRIEYLNPGIEYSFKIKYKITVEGRLVPVCLHGIIVLLYINVFTGTDG